mgnify:CR=1 FL=1
MLLSHKTDIQLNTTESNIVGHMCYAASKLWNVCNYERRNFKELGMVRYPDWYDQKARLKGNMWFKSLPSQTAQEVCKLVDKSWKSFYTLIKSKGIQNPKPPRFKQSGMTITYMQNAIVHVSGSKRVRLSLPKQLKEHLKHTYDICDNYLYLENKIFQNTDVIKQIKIYPPDQKNVCQVIVIYDVKDVEKMQDNGHYLSIDLGLHNLMTCYDSGNGKTFILGRKYLALERYFHKEIARIQSVWYGQQSAKGIKYPRSSKHIQRLYKKKQDAVTDYLHKITMYLTEYCKKQGITCVIVGDIGNIRKNKDMGHMTNQKFHGLPYNRIYIMLEYKLKMYGICFVKQKEAYTSQCSPLSPEVTKKYAAPSNRKKRGLYRDNTETYNADAVGAFNILRKYLSVTGEQKELSVKGLKNPEIIKVAV